MCEPLGVAVKFQGEIESVVFSVKGMAVLFKEQGSIEV